MCHVGGLGPQLTPFGRQFKLEGYTTRKSSEFTLPLAVMMVNSFVHTNEDQSTPPAPHYAANDNATIDQISLFAAGGVGTNFGAFTQFTYDGAARAFAWDNLDLRAIARTTIAGSPVIMGLSLNNSPGVEDAWNTLPAWSFPYTTSDLAPSPQAATVLSEALAQRVLGISGYGWWNSTLYTEIGVYWRPGRSFLRAMGVNINDGGAVLSGGSPFLRVAYQRDYGDQNFEIGASGLWSSLSPGGLNASGTDNYFDVTLDASWQFIGTGDNVFQVNGRYTHERQTLDESFALASASRPHNHLNELHLDASYYWHRKLGVTVSPFDMWGSSDALFYADNRAHSPESTGVLFQVDYTLWGTEPSPFGPRFNVRIGAQYTIYTRFDGASTNYDGLAATHPTITRLGFLLGSPSEANVPRYPMA